MGLLGFRVYTELLKWLWDLGLLESLGVSGFWGDQGFGSEEFWGLRV